MGSYVYKFIDKQGEIIYIGKTIDIESRLLNAHFTKNGHLPDECYDQTVKVFYSQLNNHDEMSIYERYLINVFTPRYNTQFNNAAKFRFILPEIEWIEFKDFKKNYNVQEYKPKIDMHIFEKLGENPTYDEIIEYNIKKYIKENIKEIKYANNKKIACIDTDTLDIKYIFSDQEEASKKIGVHKNNIYKATRKGNTCGGYYWKYLKQVI